MSLEAIRPYFRARCEAVGLTEHESPFSVDDIPDTVIDDSFHIGFNSFDGFRSNQNDQEITARVDIVFFKNGFRYSAEGIDNALVSVEALIKEVQKPSNRLGTLIKNVTTGNCVIEPVSQGNDNTIKVTISFNVNVILNLD